MLPVTQEDIHSGALRRAMNEIETLEELQHLLGV